MDIAAQTDKPIILIKANRTPAGKEIARFHTTALAGDDEVADAALKQAGIHRVQNFQDLIDCFKIFSLPAMKGKRLAIISRSGGHGVLSADAVSRYGFELADLSEHFFKTVGEKKLNIIRATNPLDVGDVYDLNDYTAIMETALTEEVIDGVVFVITYSSESDGIKIRNFISNSSMLAHKYNKPVVLCIITNCNEWLSIKRAADYPVFADVDTAMKALAILHRHNINRQELKRLPINNFGQTMIINSGRQMVYPESAFSMLKSFGLPVAEYAFVNSEEGAANAAARIGYPIALKTASPEMLHKSDSGGVKLDLVDTEDLIKAYREINSRECLVQKMAPDGVEVIIGTRYDREFGHILLFGLGGIFTEVFKDRSIRVLPVNDAIAEEMIEEIKGSALLKGYRGKPPADIDALKNILVKISAMITEHPEITDLDINPVIVFEKGHGCMMVDVKMQKS
jgi:acetate---CoA ligase (ADP-forming)